MAISQKVEARALSADERELVEKSHHPMLQEIPDAELASLVKLVRERRDKAQAQANRRRREMRGKGAPKGATASAVDDGSRLKFAVLASTVRRLNSEVERRRRLAARAELADNARKALMMKRAAAADRGPDFNRRHAREGMRNIANRRAESLVNPMERGRQRKGGAVAQARRDAR